MDPLSITVSALTLLTTVAAVVKKIQSLRSADEALRVVLEDLSDFRMLVEQTNVLAEKYKTEIAEQQRSDLASLLGRAEMKLLELDKIVESASQGGGKSILKAKKVEWARMTSKIAAIQESFKGIKFTLSTLLNTISM
jgi:hypothetical protein